MVRTFLASMLVAAAALAQQPQYGEKIDVNLVMLDAIVTDSRGNQILGLDKDNFVLTENGVPQAIDSVEYFTNRRLLNLPEQQAAFKVERLRDDRYYVFFFDKPPDAALFDRLVLARKAAADFVDKQMKPGDVVAVAAHDFRLKVFSDFTSDKVQLKRAIQDTATWGKGLAGNSNSAGPSLLRNINSEQMMNRTGTVYEGLQRIGEALRPIHARKELLLFSAGIVEPGEQIRDGMVMGDSRYYEPMIRALNQADVSVYPMNLLPDPNQPFFVHQTLSRLASETNGEYFRYNTSFTPALRHVENMTNGYYLISYYTKHPQGSSGFQKVSLTTKNPEFRIRARQGYSYGD